MAFTRISEEGVKFINHVCVDKNGMTGIEGKNSYSLPFCNTSAANQRWKCNIKSPTDNSRYITTPTEFANALIYWFNKYGEEFELDANVIAAQAYAESGYKAWNYAPAKSTASGINQFLMGTIYEYIIKNTYSKSNPFTPEEVYAINGNLKDGFLESSYSVGYYNENIEPSPGYSTAWYNRPLLHQNVIDNPGIMIKAQCTFMNYVAIRCGALTSTTLFGYSRGPGFAKSTYTASIVSCEKNKGKDSLYVREGLNYVMKIFGVLGDKHNKLAVPNLKGVTSSNYKPRGYYFGYDELKGNSTKNLKLSEPFIAWDANVKQTEQQTEQQNTNTTTTT